MAVGVVMILCMGPVGKNLAGHSFAWGRSAYPTVPLAGVSDYASPVEQKDVDGGWLLRTSAGKTVRSKNQKHDASEDYRAALAIMPGETFTNSLGMTFVYIGPGTFVMGSPSSERQRGHDEVQHQVTLTKGYWMQITEVTQGQWEAVMGINPSYFSNCGSDCPVEQVSWAGAQVFIRKLNQRGDKVTYSLPTEAEWENAARAGASTALYTGEMTMKGKNNAPELDQIAWYGGNSCVKYAGGYDSSGWKEKQISCESSGTHPVGQKKPNRYGLYDVLGNVWEWCADWRGDYPSEPVTDPAGPLKGEFRIFRGGSWYNDARYCRLAYRHSYTPGSRHNYLGLRLAGH